MNTSSFEKNRSPYSNVEVLILANRPRFTRESLDGRGSFGLLPICNKPILLRLLENIEKAGFHNINIACLEKDRDTYRPFLEQFSLPVNILKIDGPTTTAEIIRMCSKKSSHVLVIPIDFITTFNLSSLFDFHIINGARISLLINKESSESSKPGNYPGPIHQSQSPYYSLRLLITDTSSPKRLVTILSNDGAINDDLDISSKLSNPKDIPEVITHSMFIPPQNLQGYHSYSCDSSIKMTGVYILSPKCVKFIKENPDISSIESELIPLMCREKKVFIQHLPPQTFSLHIINYETLFNINFKCISKQYPELYPVGNNPNAEWKPERITAPAEFSFESDCYYGDNVTIGSNTTIRRSIIGAHVKIGNDCRLQNCVIFEHVTINDGVKLKNSIIMEGSIIPKKSDIENSVSQPKYDKPDQAPVKARQEVLRSYA